MASSRRTYDTDVITLRTVFAKNALNSNIPALRVLTADGTGATYWAIPSSLGQNPAFNEIVTTAGTYTADLSYNRFRLLAGDGIGMVNGPAGSNQTTLFGKAFNTVDVSGENSFYAYSNNVSRPFINIATTGTIQARSDPATNTLFIDGPVSNPYIVSTGQYGFYQLKVTPQSSTITSSLQGWDGSFITASSPSTLLRFIGINDLVLSTNVTTNSVFFTVSTFTSRGYLDISAAAFSAYPSTLSTVSSLYVQQSLFNSTVQSISSVTGLQFSSVLSSINALAMSTGDQFYILTGLINARATIVQLNSEISTVNMRIRSTTTGLGSAGYVSTLSLISTVAGIGSGGGGSGDVTKANLVSTVEGLGSSDYISTLSLISTVAGIGSGGGGGGDVTKANLVSTVQGLGSSDYISTASLLSTVAGIQIVPYLSSFTISTGSIQASSMTTSSLVNYGTLSTHSLVVYGASTLTVQGLSYFENIVSSYSVVSRSVGVLDSTSGLPINVTANNDKIYFNAVNAVTAPQLVSTVSVLALGGGSVTDEQIASTLRYSGYFSSVKLGFRAGFTGQSDNSIAIGKTAGSNAQGEDSVAIGRNAGYNTQGTLAVAVGTSAGSNSQAFGATALGFQAGQITQGTTAVSVGYYAGNENQGASAVAMGLYSGWSNQGQNSIAIGNRSAVTSQGTNAVAIGNEAGNNTQSALGVAIGFKAGNLSQQGSGIAIGAHSGEIGQVGRSVAIGQSAGNVNQQREAVAIGVSTGYYFQGCNAVAIGNSAGYYLQGSNSIAIGANAGYSNQAASSIVISALGNPLNVTNEGFYVAPVRYISTTYDYPLGYNSTTREIGFITNNNVTPRYATISPFSNTAIIEPSKYSQVLDTATTYTWNFGAGTPVDSGSNYRVFVSWTAPDVATNVIWYFTLSNVTQSVQYFGVTYSNTRPYTALSINAGGSYYCAGSYMDVINNMTISNGDSFVPLLYMRATGGSNESPGLASAFTMSMEVARSNF